MKTEYIRKNINKINKKKIEPPKCRGISLRKLLSSIT